MNVPSTNLSQKPSTKTTAIASRACLLVCLLAAFQVVAAGLPVLLVEVREYAGFADLPAATARLAADLDTLRQGKWLTADNSVAMTDKDDGTARFPHRENILMQAGRLAPALVVFRGRATLVNDHLCLVPADGQPGQIDRLVPVAELATHLPLAGALLVLDLFAESPAAKQAIHRRVVEMDGGSLVVAAAVSTDRRSTGLTIGEALAEALAGGADVAFAGDCDGSVTIAEAAQFLAGYLAALDTQELATGNSGASRGTRSLAGHAAAERVKTARGWQTALEAAKSLPPLAKQVDAVLPELSQALALVDQGRFTAGLAALAPLEVPAATLAAGADDWRRAIDLRSHLEALAGEAERLAVANLAPQELTTAMAARASGVDALQAGDAHRARQTLEQAERAFHQALLAGWQAHVATAIKSVDLDELSALGGQPGNQIAEGLRQAKTAEWEGKLGAAVDLYRGLAPLLPNACQSMVDKLTATAGQLAGRDTYPAALVALDRALLLVPEHQPAIRLRRQLRANLRFDPGQAVRNSLGMALVYVPPGTLLVGSPPDEHGRDADENQFEATISHGFFIGLYEVTEKQWRQVMGGDVAAASPVLPVVQVTWHEAVNFCRQLSASEGRSYRLPTEAEWEYACRGGAEAAFQTGAGALSWQDAAVFDNARPLDGPQPVGSYPLASRWGCRDMHGNVWEWCADTYAPYPTQATGDPFSAPTSEINGSQRVLRGGSWFDEPVMARSANRWASVPLTKNAMIGFRVVLEAATVE